MLNTQVQSQQINGQLLEKVLLGNDLSSLNSVEKVQYVKNICQTLGLNPVTRPIQLMKFQGKEVPYFSKDATEQLRKINNVSIHIRETKVIDDIYIVTAEATTPDGRSDSSTGAISITGLKGDAKANAYMKAETKAKRRVTLSICGLGFIDESEAESIPGAQKVELIEVKSEVEAQEIENDNTYSNAVLDILAVTTLEELQEVFATYYKSFAQERNKKGLKNIIDAKDQRKKELSEGGIL